MSLSPEVIDALVAGGATVEMLAAVVKADLVAEERRCAEQAAGERERLAAEEEADKERRARAAAKKRRQRSGGNDGDVPLCPPVSPDVPGDMPGQVGTSRGQTGTPLETKVSPTPPSKTQTPVTPPIVPPRGDQGDDRTDGLFGERISPKARRKQARALRLAGDVEFVQLWNVATPLMRRRGKSQEVVYAAWEAAKARQLPALIVAALRRYVTEDEDVKRDMGQPGLQRWLADKAYDQWLATSDGVPGITDDRWRMMVEFFHEGTPWPPDLGPPPGQPGCRAPPAILAEFDQLSSHRSAA